MSQMPCLTHLPEDCGGLFLFGATQLEGRLQDLICSAVPRSPAVPAPHCTERVHTPGGQGGDAAHNEHQYRWMGPQGNSVWVALCLLESSQEIWFVQHATDTYCARMMYPMLFKESDSERRKDGNGFSLATMIRFSGGEVGTDKQTKFS